MPSDRSTGLAVQIFEGARVARISVNEAGSDFETILDSEVRESRSKGVTIMQVCLNLALPWVGTCIEIMSSRGYFFCGTLPIWFGDDGLLMEKIEGRPNWERINLYTDLAKQILRFMRDGWERTQKYL